MSDPRFARLKTDPRFRRPKRKHQKVVVDDRFKSVFEQTRPSRVDKYGRDLPKTQHEDNLKRYYRLAHESQDEKPKILDYARGEVLMESSGEEEDNGRKGEEHQAEYLSSSDPEEEVIRIGGEDDELEIDLNEDTYAELDAQVATYARVSKDLAQRAEKEDAGITNRTRRLAAVNLDWDYVRASHLYKIFSSLVSFTAPYAPISVASATIKSSDSKKTKDGAAPVAKGTVMSVRVYPSEFGRARMEREEKEGPPPEIFKKKRNENAEINEKTVYEVGDEHEYDEDALRRYQLERLRYYYAIAEFDTVEAASHVYNELEGTELERSANVFDLSFVPDDMTFDVEPRDEATEDVLTNYKPVEYVTDALRHSKVNLTWDEDDPERYQVTRRQLTRHEIEEADFRAYIASSSSEEEDEQNPNGSIKKAKNEKEASLQKLRALLLGGNDDGLPEGWSGAGEGTSDIDMEITFTPGLSKDKNEDETTLEQYQRKMRGKRKKRKEERKEKMKAREERKGRKGSNGLGGDEFFDLKSDSDSKDEENGTGDEQKSKGARGDKIKEHRKSPSRRRGSTAEELALIAASDSVYGSEPKHFDMKAILRAEKWTGKGKKRGKRNQEEEEVQEDFEIDVNDQRFKILHEDHQFAIDPTNPHFRKTKAMRTLLEERQNRKQAHDEIADGTSGRPANDDEKSLKGLVESVKRKTGASRGNPKRRRL